MGLVNDAMSSTGKISYVFGADNISSDGTGEADCSSFTQWLFKKYGVSIGRTTVAQWTNAKGEKVSKNNLKAGDLVFFKNTYNSGYTDGVSHVGVYIGNGQFVHNSSGAGKTVVSNLDEAYYKNHYLGAKRFDVDNVGEAVDSSESSEKDSNDSETNADLKWWGDLIIVILCVLLIGLAVIFFLSAFNDVGNEVASSKPVKAVKKLKRKRGKKK